MEAAGLINASTDPIREFEDDSTFEATDLNQISSRLETHVNEAQANEAAALAASNEAQRVLEAATASATAYDQWVADVAAAEIFDLEEVSDAASDAHLDLRAMVATQINVINTWERATSSVLLLRESIGARVELLVDAGTDKDSVSLDDRVAVRALHEDLKRLLTSMERHLLTYFSSRLRSVA